MNHDQNLDFYESEFAMKDSYSFDIDDDGLDKSFNLHHDAYVAIFNHLGLTLFLSGFFGSNGW